MVARYWIRSPDSKLEYPIFLPQCREVWYSGTSPECRTVGPLRHNNICCECCVCCQVDFYTRSWSLVQSSSTDCGASLCGNYKPHKWGGHAPRWIEAPKKCHWYWCSICRYIEMTLECNSGLFFHNAKILRDCYSVVSLKMYRLVKILKTHVAPTNVLFYYVHNLLRSSYIILIHVPCICIIL